MEQNEILTNSNGFENSTFVEEGEITSSSFQDPSEGVQVENHEEKVDDSKGVDKDNVVQFKPRNSDNKPGLGFDYSKNPSDNIEDSNCWSNEILKKAS